MAQPRHRASFRGGFAKMYIPKDHAIHHWKNSIARQAFEQVENVLEHAVKVDVLFVFKARRKTEIGNFKTSKLWMAKLGIPVRHDKEAKRYFAA